MSEIITTTVRSINTITTEIRTITRQAQQLLFSSAIEIGRRLVEAKAMVSYGEWGKYLEKEVEFSQSTANNFMRIYEEYGSNQESLFETNYQALEKLSYTKALRLLALPAEERVDFIESHDVEDMSTRELEKALKERDEANAAANRVKRELEAARETIETKTEMVEDRDRKIAQIRDSQDKLLAETKARAEAAEQKLEKVSELEAALKKAKEAKAKAEKDLKAAKDNPQVPEAMLETMRKEAEAVAADKAQQAAEKAVAEAKAQARKAEADRDAAQEKLEAALKAAKVANPDLMAVQALGQQIVSTWNTIVEHKKKAVQADPANADPLERFLTKLLETLQQGIKA